MRNILLVWDIDGTLIHCGSCGRQALNETFGDLYGINNAFQYAKIGGAMDSVLLNNILKESGISPADKEKIINKYGKNLMRILKEYKENRLLPGIKQILEYTKRYNHIYNTLATSNFEIGARIKLESHGLNSYFVTGGFGDIEREKWHAVEQAVKQTEKHFNACFMKQNIYIIGDTWYDIECAKKLGFKSIAVATGWVPYEELVDYHPNFIYRDLSDFNCIMSTILNDA